jgi:Spy/CpxP family protein refolding chaperone
MRTARTLAMLALALVIACQALAAEKKGQAKKEPPCPADQRITQWLEGMTLTDAQKAKLDELKKEFGPKLMEAMKKMPELTAEQKKAQAEALKAAQEAGKKGRELMEARNAAVTLTDQQKAQQAEARKAMASLEKELREKVTAVLTPEQQEQFKKKVPEGRRKSAK